MLTGQAPFNGENVNAIMYQTLNAVPAPPNTLNPAVPEMVNFILAKALAKKVEDRYQNAMDFSVDLRACRDTLPRSGKQINVSPPGGGGKLPDAIDISGGRHMDEEEAKPAVALSQAFDSAAAPMRLAALTGTGEDVDELVKTLKVVRPSAEAIGRGGPAPPPPPPPHPPPPPAKSSGSNLMLIAVVILVLLGIVAILVA